MRKFYIILAGILFAFLFTTCKQFTADIEEDLSYWASEAFITGDTILSGYKTDTNSTRCVASKDGAAVTLTVRNPKAFSFDIPSITASSLIHFNGLAAQPQHGADYTLRQTGPNTLKLTYTQAFLEKNEQGTADLGPTIALKASDGRVFNKAYTFSIKSNSPPPKPKEIVIAKTTETPPHYVLCFQFDTTEMTRTMGTGTVPPVHKDISNITINGTSYTLLYKDDNSDFQKPAETPPIGSFIGGGVAQLTASSPAVPSGAWVLYYKTNVEVKPGNPRSEYAVTLQDAGSLTSETATAVIEATAPEYTVTYSVVGAEGGTIQADSDTATTNSSTIQVVQGGSVTFTASPATGWEVDSWSSNVTPQSPNTTATLSGVTAATTVTVKFKKKVYNVTFSVDGGTGGSLTANYGSHPSTTNSSSVQVTHGDSVTFTASPTTGWEVDSWSSNVTPQSPNTTATLSGVTAATNVTVTFKETYTVTYSVVGAEGGTIQAGSGTATTNSSTIQVVQGGSVTFTASPATGWEVDSWSSNVTPQSPNTTATLSGVTAATTVTVKFKKKVYNVTFSVDGGTGGSLTANYGSHPSTTNSSSVQVTHGDSVTFTAHPDNDYEVDSWSNNVTNISTDKKTATLSGVTAATTVTVKFKKKVYTVTFSVDGGHGTISAKPQGGSENSTGSVSVEHGKNVTFTAHPDNGWEVDSWSNNVSPSSDKKQSTLYNVTGNGITVTVKFKGGTFDLAGGYGAWRQLKEEAAKTEGGHTIVIDGTITATDLSNSGEITLGRDLTIKGKNAAAVLDANEMSRVFKVENGKTLILEDITIKNGKAGSSNEGGGAYISGGSTLIMQGSSAITGCTASRGGGVYVGGTFTMQGGATVTPSTGSDGTAWGKNDVFLASGKHITVTGALTHTPAARITINNGSGYNGRILAAGASAEKANFTVTPGDKGAWRYKEKDNAVKIVAATLKVTFTQIKCVAEHDSGSNGEYYWTMKVGGEMISERKDENGKDKHGKWKRWVVGDGATLDISGESFSKEFCYSPNDPIPVDIEIWEDDDDTENSDPKNTSDDHIGTTQAKLIHHYNADVWQWGYRDSGHENGNQGKNFYHQINNGYEVEFTEQYRHSEGDTDVTIKISWKE